MDDPHQHSSDEARSIDALTRAAAAGDRVAMDVLLTRYLDELHAFVRLRLGAAIRAKESTMDIVQSVCREVIEHSDRFKHPNEAAFKRWLYITALRKIQKRHDYYTADRRDSGREQHSLDDNNAARLLDHYRRYSTPSRTAMLRDEVARVERAFESLTDDEREVVTFAHLAGLSRKEIGEQMGRSEGAVRVLLHRALVKIAELLDESS